MILAYDVTRMDTFLHLNNWFEEVQTQSEPDVIVVLVGNQVDREHYREVSTRQGEEFRARNRIPYFIETSAKTG